MKNLRNNLPVILLTLFEFAVGVLLLVDPESFTKAVIIVFGAILVVVGAIYLIRVLRDKPEGRVKGVTIALSVLSLAAGIFCIVFPSLITGRFAEAIIYGVILIVSCIYKAKSFADAKKAGSPLPAISLVSAIVSGLFGVVLLVNPFGDKLSIFAGIALIAVAVIDFFSVIINSSGGKKKGDVADPETKDLTEQ